MRIFTVAALMVALIPAVAQAEAGANSTEVIDVRNRVVARIEHRDNLLWLFDAKGRLLGTASVPPSLQPLQTGLTLPLDLSIPPRRRS